MKEKLTLMCVQPCILYYAWQIEVMLKNFQELGISEKFDVHCLFAVPKEENGREQFVSHIQKVEAAYGHIAKFYYYLDTREYPIHYISSVRPNILKQHFKAHPELSQQAVFYHDCDVIFTKFPDFLSGLLEDDNWYVSDTVGYIGYKYIVSKGEDVLNKMCEIVGIHPDLVKDREEQSGGAQYLMKGVDWIFFEKMEKDCERMFKEITDLNNIKKQADPQYHELQIWTSDMWAILWNAWLRGYTTKIIPEMDFCWATDQKEKWEQKYIFHNAGVVGESRETVFYKADYRNNLPYLENGPKYDANRASFLYFQKIKEIGVDSCLYESKAKAIVEKYSMFARSEESKSIGEKRVEICLACDNFHKANQNFLCTKCGCQTKTKIFQENPECPEQKWLM